MSVLECVGVTWDEIRQLGCCICRNQEVVPHHVRVFPGGSRDRRPIIPLCVVHHTAGPEGDAVHAGMRAWEDAFGTQEHWALVVIMEVHRRRLVGVPGDSVWWVEKGG